MSTDTPPPSGHFAGSGAPEREALIREVARFRAWAGEISPDRRQGEWECRYLAWTPFYEAVLAFLDRCPFPSWSADELRDVLYAIARDNESQHLAREIRSRFPALLPPLARAAISGVAGEEVDTRWQLAVELGALDSAAVEVEVAVEVAVEVESILLALVEDDHEYVRRQALISLVRRGAPAAEALALASWDKPAPTQEWARMTVLLCLHHLRSPHLAPLLDEAERDERPYLRAYAGKVRRGEVEL